MTPSVTRGRLLAGTLASLRDRGLAATTSRDIAAAAGTNLQAITYHFGSKDELVGEAVLTVITERLTPALEVLRQDIDPAERMTAAVRALQSSFEASREDLAVYIEALLHAQRAPSLRTRFDAVIGEVRNFLTTQIAELKTDGYVPDWVEPGAMALLLMSIADGIALHAVLEPDVMDHNAVAQQALQLLLSARA